MPVTKVPLSKMNRKGDTRTSLFLRRSLAEQLSPNLSILQDFFFFFLPSYIFSKREIKEGGRGRRGSGRKREEEAEREKKEDSHTCAWVCVCSHKHTHKKCTHTRTHTYTHTRTAAATADPSAVRYEK